MFTIVDVNSKLWIQTQVVIYGLSGKVSRYALCMAGSVNLIRAPAPVPSHSLALMKFLIKGRYSASLGLARDPSWDSRRPAQMKAACRAGLDVCRATPLSLTLTCLAPQAPSSRTRAASRPARTSPFPESRPAHHFSSRCPPRAPHDLTVRPALSLCQTLIV